jgi:hypothetical protein
MQVKKTHMQARRSSDFDSSIRIKTHEFVTSWTNEEFRLSANILAYRPGFSYIKRSSLIDLIKVICAGITLFKVTEHPYLGKMLT